MTSRRRDREKRPARRPSTRQPRKRLLVVCEGEKTEPQYLRGFTAWKRTSLVDVVIPREHGEPTKVVNAATKLQKEAKRRAKREGDDNLLYDGVWCVIDVDEHARLADALELATTESIEVALSNPCFELWLLLHFQASPGPQRRHDLAKRLGKHIPNYNKHVEFNKFAKGYAQAKARAAKLAELAKRDGAPHPNPSTGVYRLTMAIEGEDV